MHTLHITSAQLRAGRALLRWSAQDLAKAANVAVEAIESADTTDDPLPLAGGDIASIKSALEKGGIEFVWEHGRGVGVRLARHHALTGDHLNFISDGNEG